MDSFWQSALEAAEKAKAVARSVSQKGIEFAEATAEEAGKKFKDLNLTSTIASSASPKPTASSETELISYGITPQFIEFIRSLNYNTFRDFSAGTSASPTDAPSSGADAPDAPTLNAWQLRHAMLVVRAVKEVNELRYVLCPRYMPDQKFWQVYFALAASHLPAVASTWQEGDPLPPVSGSTKEGDDDTFMSITGLQGHLKTIGTKIQAAATAATKGKVGPGGVELSSLLPALGAEGAGASGSSGAGADGTGIVAGGQWEGNTSAGGGGAPLLETDPDLEAYLQSADEERQENVSNQGAILDRENGDTEIDGGDEDDLDLDQYLNELSAEVGDADEHGEEKDGGEDDDEDGVDVEAVLKELQDEI